LFRYEDNAECIREMNELTEMGEAFYAESGVVLKLVGVLRAADIYLNPDKRYLYCRTPLCSFWKFKTVFGSIWDTDSSDLYFLFVKKLKLKEENSRIRITVLILLVRIRLSGSVKIHKECRSPLYVADAEPVWRIRDVIPDPIFFHPGSWILTVSIPDPGSS
jgi:hypothetical protein